jgi:hypothetical protein
MSRLLLRGPCLLLAALLFGGGCAGKKVVRVSGTVRYEGKPVPRLVVHFVPLQGRPSQGVTDEKGHYSLRQDRKQDGAVRGTHKVHFSYRAANPQEEVNLQEGKAALPAGVHAVLSRYGSEETALTEEVRSDGQVIDIDVK